MLVLQGRKNLPVAGLGRSWTGKVCWGPGSCCMPGLAGDGSAGLDLPKKGSGPGTGGLPEIELQNLEWGLVGFKATLVWV